MWGYAQDKAAAAGWPQQQLQLVEGDAQQMPLDDSSFDAAVMTLVLCSVPQPQAVLSELLRVLKPGGQLLLIEHVISPQLGLLQLQQRLLDPLQRLLADNCHLTRDTAAALNSTGFVPQPLPPLPVQYGTVTASDVGDSSSSSGSSSSSSALPGAAGGSGDYWRFEVEGMGLIAPHIAGILRKPL
jgi:SAM-dependent methyltransferase